MISWICFPQIIKCIFLCKTQSQTHGQRLTHTHSERHGGKIKEDHGKGIFSMLPFVSPGRQDWWRDGSISCSINALCLRVVHKHVLLPMPGKHHVTFQRSSTGRHGCVCKENNISPLPAAVFSYSLVEGSAGTSGSMFIMRFLWLRELKLRLWPNWALKQTKIKYTLTTLCITFMCALPGIMNSCLFIFQLTVEFTYLHTSGGSRWIFELASITSLATLPLTWRNTH